MDSIDEILVSLSNSHIKRIKEALKQPTIFSDHPNIRKYAKLFREYLLKAGFQKAELIETDRSPLVYGEHYSDEPKTVLVYNYFDILPGENESGEFVSEMRSIPPFGQCLTGRGARTKGSGVAFINAVEGCLKSEGKLPVNIKFLAEGEEMYGSPHIPWFIDEYRGSVSDVDAIYVPSMSQNLEGRVKGINLGGKGFVGFELKCSGGDWGKGPKGHDTHSSTKAIVDSPMWRLIEAINTFVADSGQKIMIDEFYENVQPPTEVEQELTRRLFRTFDEEGLKRTLNVNVFLHDAKGIDVLKKNLFNPTLNIEGIPYTSVDPVGVVAHRAIAKFQSRIVPNQTVDEILGKVRDHLDRRGYRDIKVKKLYGFGPGRTSLDAGIVQAVLKLYKEEGLDQPIIYPSSPTSAPVNAFNSKLGIPCASGGLGHIGREGGTEFIVIDGNEKVAGLAQSEKSFITVLKYYAGL